MDTPATHEGPPESAPLPPLVADTMRRVHAELRNGGTPSYESLLVFGAPGSG